MTQPIKRFSRYSKLIRWAYLDVPWIPPDFRGAAPSHTSICTLFWRIVLGAPLIMVLLYGLFVVASPMYILAAIGYGVKILYRYIRPTKSSIAGSKQPNLIVEYLKARKAKFCPIVRVD